MSTSAILSTTGAIDKGLAPSYQPFKEKYDLESLVQDIKEHLGESGGISSEEVNETYLISLAKKYISDPSDWIEYFHNDTGKNYTRNAIENINHKANILLLVWNPGKGSPIHDHANAHSGSNESKPLSIKSSTTYGMNEVTYISDDIGLHRVHNPHPTQIAVSLHLYTPPNAADYGYNIFDEATGSASHVSQAHSVSKK
ncbi:Cysteine dioxygenase [Penicillium malachiteum]|uniref:Cysteine dioxygenase n=1 Tax=Penicillium malachiteum TaxID=1324776 RepID=A0AAD6HNB7_9EURO|nr:Cysteine dioxygenase [Penicillium malachiteum]